MARYRVTLWQRDRPTVKHTRVVVKSQFRPLRKDTIRRAAQLAAGLHVPWESVLWTIERYEGHLDGWQVVSHNRPGPRSNSA